MIDINVIIATAEGKTDIINKMPSGMILPIVWLLYLLQYLGATS